MPVETRAQLWARYRAVVEAELLDSEAADVEVRAIISDRLGEEETTVQRSGWWEEEYNGMASGSGPEGRWRFSGKKGEGLTFKQLELMVKGSLLSRFKKLQKDVGEPVAGAEFLASYCIFLGEFLDNPARLAHKHEYEAHCKEADPVGALLRSLKRHFEDHKEGKAQEWVAFRREPGEELSLLLFRLQGLALDLEKPLKDKELVGKFVASLDRRLAEQTNTQAMASTVETGGAYSLEKAYDVALMVSAGNARLKIARELATRTAEVSKPRWGGKPVGAHAAVVPKVVQMVAAPVATGGSGACHNCGEVGHYHSGCPHPKRNSSGRNAGAGGRGGGRGRACYVCGKVGHLAAQCARRVVPVAAAAAVQQGPPGVSEAEFAEFQAWKARSQAAVATGVQDEGSDSESEWDDQEYRLGAVALPMSGGVRPRAPGPVMAAAGTKAGAEKARATRAARKGDAAAGVAQPTEQRTRGAGPQRPGPPAQLSTGGTAQIAGPVDAAALEALRRRCDKAAAKERLAKVPDHGRNTAPQGLHRLPQGFSMRVRNQPGLDTPAREAPLEVAGAPGRGADREELGQRQGVGTTQAGTVPVLAGEVTLPVLAFLELAQGAWLSLSQVTMMARGGVTEVVTPPIRLPAEGAGLARTGQGAARLSPIAVRAQSARVRQTLGVPILGRQEEGGPPQVGRDSGPRTLLGRPSSKEESREVSEQLREWEQAAEASAERDRAGRGAAAAAPQGREGPERPESLAMGAARGILLTEQRVAQQVADQPERPESSAMGTARGALLADQRIAMELAAQERALQVGAQEHAAACISKDAELALQLMSRDAAARGVSHAAALEAQVGPQPTTTEVSAALSLKGKEKVTSIVPTAMEQGTVLAWEKRLSTGAWQGSSELARVVLQPQLDPVVAAAAGLKPWPVLLGKAPGLSKQTERGRRGSGLD